MGAVTGPQQVTYVPVQVPGQGLRVQAVPFGGNALEFEREQQESARRQDVADRRLVYAGLQYDALNVKLRELLIAAGDLRPDEPTPEHERLHAYSSQVQEAVDYLADRLAEGFTVTAGAAAVQAVLDAVWLASDQLSGEDDDGSQQGLTVDEPLREALTAGDVAAFVGWDPEANDGAGSAFVHLWESEHVEIRARSTNRVDEVIRIQRIWVNDPAVGLRQVVERVRYLMQPNPHGVPECRADTYWDEQSEPRRMEWLGVGRIPWKLLRCDPKGLRAVRGESLITDRVISAARRYDANEQHSYLIGRYNSHGNVAAVGDAAALMLNREGQTVRKDVADVMVFPSGSQLIALSLPTDPAMIEHQRKVLADQIFGAFGLVRLDQETIKGFGAISGYALEILNQRTESAHRKLRRNWRGDFRSLCSLILDVTAWRRSPQVAVALDGGGAFTLDLTDPAAVPPADAGGVVVDSRQAFWLTDPDAVFPDRSMTITMGSGYVVDDVMIRDDVVAGVISKREGLRQRGYGEEAIDTIMGELADEQAERVAATLTALPGRTGNTAPTSSTQGTQAGGTLGTVQAAR